MNNLAVFPEFRPFTASDIKWYKKFYLDNGLNPYADIHYGNLLTWLNINDDLNVSRLDDKTIVFKYTNPLSSNETNLLPLSRELNNENIEKLLAHSLKMRPCAFIQEIPSIICKKIDTKRWIVLDYTYGYEYIYSVKEHSELLGPRFANQRRVRSHFERTHASHDVTVDLLDCSEERATMIILDFIANNSPNSNKFAAESNVYEAAVIKKGTDLADFLDKKVMTITIDGKTVAIAIISFLDHETISLNHIKVDYSVRDIFNYTFYRLALLLTELEIKKINLEQDLGIEGMRLHKEKLRPIHKLEKKIIRHQPQ